MLLVNEKSALNFKVMTYKCTFYAFKVISNASANEKCAIPQKLHCFLGFILLSENNFEVRN